MKKLLRKLIGLRGGLVKPEAERRDSLPILSAQLSAIKQDLKLMLWIELPTLNGVEKYEALYQGNDFKFSETFLERKATRKAFWRRLAKETFKEDQDRRNFVKLAEKEFKGATLSWQEFLWGKKK
ncbi:phage protein [Streptococcus pyogenes]|nr:phage protein [Streptococcus pyogenes]VGY14972.1 phage protein [Streptococcus pyogenes]VGY53094.1 phage protein [Streptococcus pyogenes]VGZ11614.1 phage protein [Streptococcus pyogenes]VHA00299.1 phage protein [Streptococcus pyogenes]